jgi:GntR family histidine utilization transcriptional repressor
MNATLQYQRIKSYILGGINDGQWASGALLPSENQLAERFSLSRMTVNRAIKELESDGVVERIRGKGTFVAPPKPLTSVLKIQGIDQEIIARGGTYCCDVAVLREAKATAEVATQLEVKRGSRLFHSCIVHFENDTPIQFAQRWLSPWLAPEFLHQDFSIMTPHEYLMGIAPFTHGEHRIEACMPAARIRNRLSLSENEPALLIHRRTWVNERVATYVKLYHPGNRFQITTQLSRQGP